MNLSEDLEFAVREYRVITEHLVEVLERCDDRVPATIKGALYLLAESINSEWLTNEGD